MKASELRIRNLMVDYENDEHFYEVEEIKKNDQGNLSVYYRGGSSMSIDPEPILITEEWLVKLGFEKSNRIAIPTYSINSEYELIIDKIYGFALIKGWEDMIKDNIQYVHELQNLYFALTGEELKIKE